MTKAMKTMTVGLLMMMALVVSAVGVSAASKSDVQGLVFIDDNLNGVWDEGEAGYDGEWMWDEDSEAYRYVGATVTVTTPSYEEITAESAPYREPDEDETIVCTQQDLVVDGEINPNPTRPCSGTWGVPRLENDSYLTITLTPPEGYTVTSENPQIFLTGTDTDWVDFGIAPIDADAE